MNRPDSELQRRARLTASEFPIPDPPFEFKIGWAETYDALLAETFIRESSTSDLLTIAQRKGRVIVHASAGSGKTVVFQRLFKEWLESGVSVWLDLGKWTPAIDDLWRGPHADDYSRLQVLLSDIGEPATEEDELVDIGEPILLFVDGLSEVLSPMAATLLRALEGFARRNPQSGVLVADRLSRRRLPSRRWGLARIKPLSEMEVHNHAPLASGVDQSLLRRPFFLNLVTPQGTNVSSSSDALKAFLTRQVRITEPELLTLSLLALRGYEVTRSRFLDSGFSAEAGPSLTRKLVEADVLRLEGSKIFFTHQLFQDYLASVCLATRPDMWRAEHFDDITLRATSFDSLALVLEQLSAEREADTFLRAVYDWNFYGSAYALARSTRDPSSLEMKVALSAMLAERRWDVIRSTVERVSDALRILRTPFARTLLAASSLEDVFRIVHKAVPVPSEEVSSWKSLFLTHPGGAVEDEVVRGIEELDSLIGWTTSNVLKRSRLTTEQLAYLQSLASSPKPNVVRWRAVHTLGAHPSRESAELLLGCLNDPYHWVRYGSVRSLVEHAARDSSLRSWVMNQLSARIDAIAKDDRTLWEFATAIVLRNPPVGWSDVVRPVVEELWIRAETLELQDRWRELGWLVESVQAEAT